MSVVGGVGGMLTMFAMTMSARAGMGTCAMKVSSASRSPAARIMESSWRSCGGRGEGE